MPLADRIHSRSASIGEIASVLDEMSPGERTSALSGLKRATQRALFEKAHQSEPLDIDFFVPRGVVLESVDHFGRNTLPLPGKHNFFEKRFCRASEDANEVFGYNHSPSRKLIGPGYFVAYATGDRADWSGRGSVVIDYFRVPSGPVPPAWPEIVPNSVGLQRFVFAGTRDFMRRVSKHVSIGAAYKGDKPLDHYFVLCRPE